MSRRPARFTEAELRRLSKSAKENGVSITVETTDGRITFRPSGDLPDADDPANLDRTLMDRIRNRPWARSK